MKNIKIVLSIGVIMAAGIGLSACSGQEDISDYDKDYSSIEVERDTSQSTSNYKVEMDTVVETKQEEPIVVTPEPETPSATMSQIQAVRKAESYLNYTSFSRQGLIDQLEYSGFSNEDATYAVDNVIVDWNEQAIKKAESYLEYSSFSRQGLIDQMIYTGFTQEQAVFGVDATGL